MPYKDENPINYHTISCHNNSSSSDSSQNSHLLSQSTSFDHQGDTVECQETSTRTHALSKLIWVAAATAATLGYDVGIMAAAIQPLEAEMNLNSVQKEVAMGSLNFVSAVGALLASSVANQRGRKPTIKVCSWLFVVGTLCMALAPDYWILLLGRVITGIGVGVSFVVAPVYLSEVSPAEIRGQINTVFDVAINGGILLGYVVGLLVQTIIPESSSKWRVMLGIGIILPVAVIYNIELLPESPRWLVMTKQSEAASQVLEQIGQNPRQIIRTVTSIEEELASDEQNGCSSVISLRQAVLSMPRDMRLAIALGFWQQITGTEAVLYYSADFLSHAGLESATQRLLGNCLVGLCKLTPDLIAMQLVDRVGRQPLIRASAVLLTASLGALSVAFYVSLSPMWVVVLLCSIMSAFSIGIGPFTYLIASESLGTRERAVGMTLTAAANRCTSGIVALTAVSLYERLGNGGLFALYGAVGLLSLPFYFTQVPETSGQTLEQLAAARALQTARGNVIIGSVGSHPEHVAVPEAALRHQDCELT